MHSCKLLVTRKHMFCVSLSNAYIDMYASQRGKQRESLHVKWKHKTIASKTPSNLMHSEAGKLLSSKCRVSLQCRAKPLQKCVKVTQI